MRKKQNSNLITTAKLSISAPLPAKPPSTKTQPNTLAALEDQDTAAAAVVTAKPLRLGLTFLSLCF
jgi:hypothetical protein